MRGERQDGVAEVADDGRVADANLDLVLEGAEHGRERAEALRRKAAGEPSFEGCNPRDGLLVVRLW